MKNTEYSAVLTAPHKIELQEFDIPAISPNDGLLKLELTGVCGTDAKFYLGKRRTDIFPMILGHEILGRVNEIGDVARERFKVKKGDRVVVDSMIPCSACPQCINGNYKFCQLGLSYGTRISTNVPPSLWGSYGQYMYLHPNSILYKISEDIPAEAAILANAAISNGIQWVRFIGGAKVGDVVVIQGSGSQGLSAVIAAKESGASEIIVTGLGRDEERLKLAGDFGATVTVNIEKEDAVKLVRELTGGKMADLVVDVTGSPRGVAASVDLVKKQGTLVCAGLSGSTTETPLLMDKIVLNEITLKGVFTSNFEAISAAIKLIETRKYPIERMVTHKFPLKEADKAVRAIAGEIPGLYPIKAVIQPG
ncbi:MAG: zinc-binding dehydrogenase [Dehalococcoidia bacterium]|nr:zinc-binding dehydrogenase [Dehalococcoidia bacterium]MDZ4247232.1 zinc-binding dehydrogenase [Dehalococcoidia bacterium]